MEAIGVLLEDPLRYDRNVINIDLTMVPAETDVVLGEVAKE